MPRRKPIIDRSQDDMVDPNAFRRALEQAEALPSKADHIRPVSLADADAALYGNRGPEASPDKKAFTALKMFTVYDPSTWTPEHKTAIIDSIAQLRRWLDDLEAKTK